MITVGELIEILRGFDPALPVLTPGFDEGGFDDIDAPHKVTVVPIEKTSHGSAYEDPETLRPRWDRQTGEPFEGVVISF